jgi:endosialidase-like protein
MKSGTLALIGTLAFAGATLAQVPSTNDTSDTISGNTGMGTGALGGPNPVNLTGTHNTASGVNAL